MNQPAFPDRSGFQGQTEDGQTDLYILQNNGRLQVAITNFGARIVGIHFPDAHGQVLDLAVGFDSVGAYKEASEPYYGAIVGRYANRIAKGKFKLEEKEYTLACNNGPNHLHGGKKGFQYVVWKANQPDPATLELVYKAADGEEGYPGNLDIRLVYRLEEEALKIDFEAGTDAPTVLNLTNHAYFNLNGEGSGPITGHSMVIEADQFTPVDKTLIPTGDLAQVADTPFDFRTPQKIGARIGEDHPQLQHGGGYDHNFVLRKGISETAEQAALATGDRSGITLRVLTTEPGLQLYTGNFMKGDNRFKSGDADTYRTAFCLETQHFPDSPNHPQFPTTVLRPGETFRSSTVFAFGHR